MVGGGWVAGQVGLVPVCTVICTEDAGRFSVCVRVRVCVCVRVRVHGGGMQVGACYVLKSIEHHSAAGGLLFCFRRYTPFASFRVINLLPL